MNEPWHNPTKGYRKLRNYFENVIRKKTFQNAVFEIRREYKIPSHGFIWSYEGKAVFEIPAGWEYSDNESVNKKLDLRLQSLGKKFGLIGGMWEAVLHEYIFWGDSIGIDAFAKAFDMCQLEDDFFKKLPGQEKRKLSKMFPIIVRISPYASGKEIIDFIKKNSKPIKILQDRYLDSQVKLKEVRSRKPKLRAMYDFIYRNRHLPRKNLLSILNSRYKRSLLSHEITGIISLEEERRN